MTRGADGEGPGTARPDGPALAGDARAAESEGARPGLTYRDAGVDIEAADRLKRRLGELVESTRTGDVRARFGSFGGRFAVGAGELVASADGVGTKLRVAFRTGRHDTVGQDLVNHCVDDILAEGAVPLVFLDYFACGRLDPDVAWRVVSGVAKACRENGCALLGGETAEMPDSYPADEYDLAGFIVGRVEWPEVADRRPRPGDRLVGLASSGLHTNGYSLARRVLFDRLGLGSEDELPGTGASVADVLLRVHRSYLPALRPSLEAGRVRALAHITGGGIPGNLRRVLPGDADAEVRLDAWRPPAEFRFLAERTGASRDELHRTFNMGVGMIAVAPAEEAGAVAEAAAAAGCPAWECGEVVPGAGEVRLLGDGE